MGGVAEYQNQTMKQAFREMLKNTASKSRCGWAGQKSIVLQFVTQAAPVKAARAELCSWQAAGQRAAAASDTARSLRLHRSYAKGFAAMGALFAGSECLIESYRARHDSRNSVYAGCATGAILGYSGGPKAMCIGCASFAAFSVLIDR